MPKAKTILLVASGDLRPSANETCWPAQHAMEQALTATVAKLGYKLVRNQWNDYDASSSTGCQQTTENELYIVGEENPINPNAPLLDTAQRMIPTPYNQLAQSKYDELTNYLDTLLASEPNCLAQGDGNDDGVVNLVDLANYKKMAKKTSGSSWYDVNTDGYTNGTDRQIISQNLGLSCKTR